VWSWREGITGRKHSIFNHAHTSRAAARDLLFASGLDEVVPTVLRFTGLRERTEHLDGRFPKAVSVRYHAKTRRIVIHLSSRLIVSFSRGDVEGLEHAQPSQLNEIEISPSGVGIHFPAVVADLYVPGLLEGFLGSKTWMASRLGQLGGQSRSKTKKIASRANGKLGGRPAKAVKR
jgi:hypothetical protein